MNVPEKTHRGFTLIELLVCLAIGSMLVALATTAFFQTRTLVRRSQARLAMNNSARFIFEDLRADLTTMMPHCAWFVDATGNQVRLVFMKSKTQIVNFDTRMEFGFNAQDLTDLVWCEWQFTPPAAGSPTGILATGINADQRVFTLDKSWKNPGGYDYRDTGDDSHGYNYSGDAQTVGNMNTFANVPKPRRIAATVAAAAPQNPATADASILNDNGYLTGSIADTGDWTDLNQNLVPVNRNITDFQMQFLLMDGSLINASVAGGGQYACNGVYMDGRATGDAVVPIDGVAIHDSAKLDNAKRPRLIRVMFTMLDRPTGVTESFTFSFQGPDMLPAGP